MSIQDPNLIPPETQQQRWLKYGGNVVLTTVIVIALAVGVIYISETKLPKKISRIDTTTGGLYSLKPQTIAVIKDNKQKITIISLYTKAKQTQSDVDQTADESAGIAPVDKPAMVSDLLDEYRTQGANISTETIDPDANPGKVEDLINDVMKNYGGEVQKYKAFTDTIPAKYDSMITLSKDESDKMKAVFRQLQGEVQVSESVLEAYGTVQELPSVLKQGQDDYKRALNLKVPDYKRVTDSVSENMTALSQLLGKVIDGFNRSKDDAKIPQVVRDYMSQSLPRYTDLKRQADDLLAAEKGLGELKLDTLRDALKQKDPILVRGKDEWRVIPYEKVWKTQMSSRGNGPARPQFAGEQMITTAILSLNQPTKLKVCFVRAGGPPITDFGGRLNSIADRLRDYNFDVSEKDLSGTYAMQAMQQQQQAPPEPSDTDIDDAVWVVDGVPAQSNPMMGGAPPGISSKVSDHLEHGHHWVDGKKEEGGSAFVMFVPSQGGMGGDNPSKTEWTAALRPWGIEPRTDAMAVHQFIETEGEADTNIVNIAQHNPVIFTFTDWGDHMITKPIASLMGLLLQAVPIQLSHVEGVSNTPLIPVPGAPKNPECWGAVNLTPEETHPKFDRKKDIPPPLYCGAVAEKAGQRVVCMGSEATLTGSPADPQRDLVDYPDMEIQEKKHMYAPQFPGSAEFFMNSVFWLSHQETMIAISPAAMNVSRISEIKPVTLAFWHIGVLLIGLPGLVIVGGAFAYFSRQD